MSTRFNTKHELLKFIYEKTHFIFVLCIKLPGLVGQTRLASDSQHFFTGVQSFRSKIFSKYIFSFFGSKLGASPSYTWCSIWESKGMLEKWYRWCVGNGLNIKVWKDKWVTTSTNFIPVPRVWNVDEHATVNEFINPLTMQWDRYFLDKVFTSVEANYFSSIPISRLNAPVLRISWFGIIKRRETIQSGVAIIFSHVKIWISYTTRGKWSQ